MLKEKLPNIQVKEIFSLIEDILRYFENEESEDYKTNQAIIRMKDLFRGYVVKVQKGINFSSKKYTKLNKIVIKHCVKYYNKCWNYRNKYYHNDEKQKERIIKQYKNIKRHVEDIEPLQVRIFIRRNKLNLQNSLIEIITRWVYNVKEIIKKVSKLPQNDKRRYCEI